MSCVPGSTYTGTVALTAVPTTTFSNDPAKPAVAGTFTYTADPPATVNQDYNANTSTWCSFNGTSFTRVSGTGSCPTALSQVTAFMFVATPDLAAVSVSGGTRSAIDVTFTLQEHAMFSTSVAVSSTFTMSHSGMPPSAKRPCRP